MTEPVMFERVWCMPNRYTFSIQAVKEFVEEEINDFRDWVDPFAGFNSPAGTMNDTDPMTPAQTHKDALSFLKDLEQGSFWGCLFDPPYSAAMAGGKYANPASWIKYIHMCKDEIARIVKPGGKAICLGWNSNGLGQKRGFKLVRGLLLAHGGSHQHDTIITVEIKGELQ